MLCAVRAGGARVTLDEMSEGTADQLYLALRLAALDVRVRRIRRCRWCSMMRSSPRMTAVHHIRGPWRGLRRATRCWSLPTIAILLEVARRAIREHAFVAYVVRVDGRSGGACGV